MGLFDKITQPVILKEDSSLDNQLKQLTQFLQEPLLPSEVKEQVEQDIRFVKAGIFGENNLLFELKNSHLPLYVLRDIYIEGGDLSAQIDFLVVTRKMNFVIECKNLYGNIEIDSTGSFIRTMQYGKHYQKTGIYSPITQNERHLELIRHIRSQQKGFLAKKLYLSAFHDNHRAIVVLANPQTVLNARYAKKEVRDKVIRADQLIAYMKAEIAASKNVNSSDDQMKEIAEMFLGLHQERDVDYIKKYREKLPAMAASPAVIRVTSAPEQSSTSKTEINASSESAPSDDTLVCIKCGAPMIKRVASKGKNAGKTFYGCSKFPNCRNIINITDGVS